MKRHLIHVLYRCLITLIILWMDFDWSFAVVFKTFFLFLSALLLNSIMAAFKPEYISARALEFTEMIKECEETGFPKVRCLVSLLSPYLVACTSVIERKTSTIIQVVTPGGTCHYPVFSTLSSNHIP